VSSVRFAARTVLAAAGGCCPVDRHASVRVCRWTGTAVPATVAHVTTRPGRWCARSGPLSVAGSCRPSPDRLCDTTSADRALRTVVAVTAQDRKSGATEGALVAVALRADAAGVDDDARVAAAAADQPADAAARPHPCATSCQAPPTTTALRTSTHSRSVSLTSAHYPVSSSTPAVTDGVYEPREDSQLLET
jgi:hypothetical protein